MQDFGNSQILEEEARHNQSIHSQTANQVRSLEIEIETAIANYEQLLQLEKNNSKDRSDFLLHLIKTTRKRHSQELAALKGDLEFAINEKEEAKALQRQMESIGAGVDSIVEEGKRLKKQNESLQIQFEEQIRKERKLEEQIESGQSELDQLNQKIDTWERSRIKWNRRKKEMLEMIEENEKSSNPKVLKGIPEYT